MSKKFNRGERGFSFIEVLVSALLVSILVAIAIPNYHEVKGRVYDATLKSDIRNIKVALSNAAANRKGDGYNYLITNGNIGTLYKYSLDPFTFSFQNFNLDNQFPEPFNGLTQSDGTRVYGAYEYSINGNNYMYIYATHEKSKHRFYEYNNGNNILKYAFNNF